MRRIRAGSFHCSCLLNRPVKLINIQLQHVFHGRSNTVCNSYYNLVFFKNTFLRGGEEEGNIRLQHYLTLKAVQYCSFLKFPGDLTGSRVSSRFAFRLRCPCTYETIFSIIFFNDRVAKHEPNAQICCSMLETARRWRRVHRRRVEASIPIFFLFILDDIAERESILLGELRLYFKLQKLRLKVLSLHHMRTPLPGRIIDAAVSPSIKNHVFHSN